MFSVSLTASARRGDGDRHDGLDHRARRARRPASAHSAPSPPTTFGMVATSKVRGCRGPRARAKSRGRNRCRTAGRSLPGSACSTSVGGAGIGGRFQHDELARAQMLAIGLRGRLDEGRGPARGVAVSGVGTQMMMTSQSASSAKSAVAAKRPLVDLLRRATRRRHVPRYRSGRRSSCSTLSGSMSKPVHGEAGPRESPRASGRPT